MVLWDALYILVHGNFTNAMRYTMMEKDLLGHRITQHFCPCTLGWNTFCVTCLFTIKQNQNKHIIYNQSSIHHKNNFCCPLRNKAWHLVLLNIVETQASKSVIWIEHKHLLNFYLLKETSIPSSSWKITFYLTPPPPLIIRNHFLPYPPSSWDY